MEKPVSIFPLVKGRPPVRLLTETLFVGGSWRPDRVYDPELIEFFFAQMETMSEPIVVDIGAGTGSFALLAYFKPDAKVVAYEPNYKILTILQENIVLNELQDRVRTLPYAISNYNGMGTLKIPQQSGMACLGNPLRFKHHEEQEVLVRCLDDIWTGPLDMFKIDTEGCELLVLEGAQELIKQYRPAILLEYNELNTQQFNYPRKRIKEFLFALGYTEFKHVGREDLWAT